MLGTELGGRRWVLVTALLAIALIPSGAHAKKADLAVTQLKGVPAKALSGDGLSLKVKVSNQGKGKSKPAKVSAQLAAETGSPRLDVIGRGKVGALAPKRSKTLKLKAAVPRTSRGAFSVAACVPPRSQPGDCRASSRMEVGDGSSWGLIEAARAAGELSPGQADLYGLYALTGDKRLPKPYRGHGEGSDAGVFARIAEDWPSLAPAEQDAIWPYLLQPRYAQSAWAPAGKSRATPAVASRRGPAPPAACADLNRLQGAWNGIETAHAVFWHAPGSSAGRANAQRLAREFEQKVWPKLTGAFKAVDDAAAAPCDPVGNAKIDVYLGAAGQFVGGAEGVAPPVRVGPTTGCGPVPAFIVIDEGEDRWTLAHEFFHVIQWAYAACVRDPAWVEGTAAWAGDFVYARDQEEHRWHSDFLLPYSSMLDAEYDAWPFWYSVAKHHGAAGIKTFLEALGGNDFAGALAALPGGLREAWKQYAVERWNQTPIGASGFGVRESFAKWDSFGILPARDFEEPRIVLDGQAERTYELRSYGSGGQASGGNDLGPLSTSFKRVTVEDRNVRELRFRNALAGSGGTGVQAFLKLENGNWRLEDWSEKGTVTLCRDKEDENVTELIVATSNASATGGAIGRVAHELRARNQCEPALIQGSFNGSERYTSSDGEVEMTYNFNGTVEFEPNGQGTPWFPAHYSEFWPRYTVRSGSYHLSGGGTTYNGCTVELVPATFQIQPANGGVQNEILVQPGSEPLYGINVSPTDLPQALVACPPDNTKYPTTFSPPGSLIRTEEPAQTTRRGTYQGTSTPSHEGYSGNYGWSLSGG